MTTRRGTGDVEGENLQQHDGDEAPVTCRSSAQMDFAAKYRFRRSGDSRLAPTLAISCYPLMVLSRVRLLGGCLSLACAMAVGSCSTDGSTLAGSGNGNPPGGGMASGASTGSGTTSTGGSATSGTGGTGFTGSGGSATNAGTGGLDAHGSGGASTTAGTNGSSPGTGGAFAGTGGSPAAGTGGVFAGGGGSSSLGGAGGGAGRPGTAAGGSFASGSGGQTGAGPTGQCPPNAIFCADFESGSIPSLAIFFPEYLRATMATYLTVDATTGYNSTHAAKFAGTSFSQMLGVNTGTSTFWTRVYLRSDVDISTNSGHATYVEATDGNGDPNMGEQIRVGEHECQLEINRRSDDKELLSNGGTYQCSGGTIFARNTWYCLETYYNGPGAEVRVFVNGSETAPLHVTNWGPYSYGMFKFGFENYSSQMRTMWYDDVAIAPQQIGCH